MHILIAPSEHPITHFTWAAFTVLMDFMFSNPAVRRIVVEPDITNEKIHALNERAGFQYQKVIQLSNKTAHLAFCTKESYQAALRNHAVTTSPKQVVAHLQAGLWAKVNRLHLCKAISEFAHELLIQPELESTAAGWGHYVLRTDNHAIDYRFRAQRLSLDHWFIDKNSLQKWLDGKLADLDSLTFILEIRSRLAIDPAILPTYMEEINSTLYGSAYKHCKKTATVVELIAADFQTVEAAMMEGHPAFLANNGRIGFDANDYYAYAPEAAAPIQLVWLAVHKSKATFACADDVSYSQLLAQELGLAVIAKFTQILAARGLNSDDYWLMPAHPWQWYNKLVHHTED
jgi:siderophore synthetase component